MFRLFSSQYKIVICHSGVLDLEHFRIQWTYHSLAVATAYGRQWKRVLLLLPLHRYTACPIRSGLYRLSFNHFQSLNRPAHILLLLLDALHGMASSFAPPKLSDFILTEKLGSGTYATVYKAYRKVSVLVTLFKVLVVGL